MSNQNSGVFIRYLIVGAGSNLALYGVYLALEATLLPSPIIASTTTFILGVAITYLGNTLWSFSKGAGQRRRLMHGAQMVKYILAYLTGLVVQVGVLALFLRVTPLPHQFAQLIGMGCAAVCIFILLNFWVYHTPEKQNYVAKQD